MMNMKNGDILMYLDSGCEIGGKKHKFITDFLNMLKRIKLLVPIQHI